MLPPDPLARPDRLITRVYAYAAYRLGDGPDAEDVTSEVFERALRYRENYDPNKGQAISWLLGIARRCVDVALSGRRPVAAELSDMAGADDIEGETLRRLTLSGALLQLTERDQELIALRYGADLTARQIAEIIGATTNAVEVRLHRALNQLRALLAEPAGEGSGLGEGSEQVGRVRFSHADSISVVEQPDAPRGELA